MAWTAPRTWVTAEVVNASNMNTHVRDNFNETAPAKATAASQIFVSDAANSLTVRSPLNAAIATTETTASTTFTDLATTGPTVTTGTGVFALVIITARMSVATAGAVSYAAVDISGATSSGAADARAFQYESGAANDFIRASQAYIASLTAGTNTFKMQYHVNTGTGTFRDRNLTIVPF
jgi:hypothetical protein